MNDLKLKHNKKCLIPLLFIMFIPLSWAVFIVGSVYRNITIILAVLFVISVKGKLGLTKANSGTLIIWTVYVLYTVVSLAWSTDSARAINNCMGMVLVYVIVLIFANVDTNKIDTKYYDLAWIFVGILCAMFFMFGSIEQVDQYGERETLVILGNKTDPNEFAGTFSVTAAINMYYVLKGKKLWIKLINVVLMVLQLYVILSCGSRGALIAAIVSIVATIIVFFKPTLGYIFGTILLVVASILAIQFIVLPQISGEVADRFSIQSILSDGGSGRSSIWKSGLTQFFDGDAWRILFGFGYGGVVAEGMYDATATMHNQFVQIFVNYGIVGFILYIALLARCLFLLMKYNKRYVGGFIGMMALSMTLSLPPTYKPFWVLLTMAFIGMDRRRKSSTLDIEKPF